MPPHAQVGLSSNERVFSFISETRINTSQILHFNHRSRSSITVSKIQFTTREPYNTEERKLKAEKKKQILIGLKIDETKSHGPVDSYMWKLEL